MNLLEGENTRAVPPLGFHVSKSVCDEAISDEGLQPDSRGNVYVWDTRSMADWFATYQNDDHEAMTIWAVDLVDLDVRPDPEAENMSEWSSRFQTGQSGGAWIIGGRVSPARLRRL